VVGTRTHRRIRAALLFSLITAALPAASLRAQPRTLSLIAGEATFTAKATLGDFTGRTRALRGEVQGTIDPWSASGWVEVSLDSLRTGNGMRDGHMRDALETATYPVARFTLDSLRPEPSVTDGTAQGARLFGQFTVHGVSRSLATSGVLESQADGVWTITTAFPVTLADHGITKGLSRAFGTIKVGPVVSVRVRAEFASR
jgi:polyisoprenoid-binding protein YceI